MSLFKYAAVAVTLLSFTACTSMQPIEDVRPSTIRQQVAVGDRASVVFAKVRYDITVTAVDAEAVHGVTDSGKAYKFPFEGIQAIDVEQSSGGRTLATAVVVAVTAFVILLILSFRIGDPSSCGWDCGSSSSGHGD